MARYTQAGRGETDAGGDARARGGKKINLYGSRRTGAEGHRESPTRKSRGWDEPKMERARGVDGDRHVVTRGQGANQERGYISTSSLTRHLVQQGR